MNIFFRAGELLPNFKIQLIYSALLSVLCFSMFSLSAQTPRQNSGADGLNDISALKIGDTIPETLWNTPLQVTNHPSGKEQITLNDYRDKKLIILDFWATWCPPCIESLGKLSGLSRSNSRDMAGLAIAVQDRAEIDRFFARRKDKIVIPSVVKDSVLSTYFPHASVPHIIWIHDNKVHSITWHNAVTAANIRDAVQGKQLPVVPKRENLSYNLHKPLAMDFNGGTSEDLLYHSLFTGFLEGVTGAGTETTDKSFKIRAINTDILGLYKMAAIGIDPLLNYNNRNVIKVQKDKDIKEIKSPLYNPEVRDKFFSYELIVPLGLKQKAHGMMLEDLNRFFGVHSHIKGRIEKLSTPCWVLKADSGAGKLMSPDRNFVEGKDLKVYNNYPFRTFFRNVIAYRLRNESLPIIDETGIDGNISIAFPKTENDLGRLRAYLRNYGLSIEKETREIDMLVILDSNQ